jgi:hypothetical protein
MSLKVPHPGKLSLYTLLSISDLFLTRRLVQQSGGLFYECNPIANAWLNAYGWAGLAGFKVAAMLLVAAATAYISLRRPRTGGHVLRFACCAVAVVVAYSCWLAGSVGSRLNGAETEPEYYSVAKREFQRARPVIADFKSHQATCGSDTYPIAEPFPAVDRSSFGVSADVAVPCLPCTEQLPDNQE